MTTPVPATAEPATAEPAIASGPTAEGAPGAPPVPGLALAAIDALACAALACAGAGLVRVFFDPFGFGAPLARAALAAPAALVGPLGVGIERGRQGRVAPWVAVVVSLGAASGAALGLWLCDFRQGFLASLALRCLPALVLGPLLARAGTRLAREDEAWRAAARLGPPEATPALARRIARARVPLALRVVLAPLALLTLPVGLALTVLIRCYQLTLSRLMPPQCRFEPSCSRYGFEAVWKLGLVRGFLLAAFRVGRCHPFCEGGHDPVPGAGR